MSKKNFLIIGLGGLAILVLGIIFVMSKVQKEGFVSSILEVGQPKESSGKSLTYEDEAGFAFQYPSTLGVIEKDINDPTVYSSLELSSKDHPGEKLVLKIADTSFSTIDNWIGKNPQEGNLARSTETSLGGMTGKNLQYANPSRSLILVINNGILYLLQAPEDQGFWAQAFKMVSESFQLTESKNTGGGAAVIDEGEEIIE